MLALLICSLTRVAFDPQSRASYLCHQFMNLSAAAYPIAAREGRALDLPATVAAAMRARGPAFAAAHRDLLGALDAVSGPAPDRS